MFPSASAAVARTWTSGLCNAKTKLGDRRPGLRPELSQGPDQACGRCIRRVQGDHEHGDGGSGVRPDAAEGLGRTLSKAIVLGLEGFDQRWNGVPRVCADPAESLGQLSRDRGAPTSRLRPGTAASRWPLRSWGVESQLPRWPRSPPWMGRRAGFSINAGTAARASGPMLRYGGEGRGSEQRVLTLEQLDQRGDGWLSLRTEGAESFDGQLAGLACWCRSASSSTGTVASDSGVLCPARTTAAARRASGFALWKI